MITIERKVIAWIIQRKNILFFLCITALALAIRYIGRDLISDDMSRCLIPWFDVIQEGGGLVSLRWGVGNYNLLYQTLIALMSFIPINCVYQYKLLSVLFDFILALSAAWYLRKFTGRDWTFFNLAYAFVILLPTVVLNSAFWGQCDAMYTAFVILFLGELYQGKYKLSFIFLGLAFACKLQAVFILPFAVAYYFYKKKFSAVNFGLSLLTFWATGIVAFVYGRGLLEPFRIYAEQSDSYQNMWLSVASFWQLVGDNYQVLHKFAVFITLALCGAGLYLILLKRVKLDSPKEFFSAACWFVWVCILFLPAMHERYTYLLDILLLMLALLSVKYVKYALVSISLSLVTYGAYLFGARGIERWMVFLYVAAFVHFTYTILSECQDQCLPQKEIKEERNAL